LRAAATAAAQVQNDHALSDLSDEERDVFLDLMRRVVRTMKDSEDG
jgi:hypothetical protein